MEIKASFRVCGGVLLRITHQSSACKCPMTFAVFVPESSYEDGIFSPPQVKGGKKMPVLFYLSGLTCNDENASQKLGAYPYLRQARMACVFPDTSPRGCNVAGEADAWDFGVGAGFYLDATQEPWATNWRMESYIVEELPAFLAAHFPTLETSRLAITGHSMGGHGALTLALKHPTLFHSVSSLSPISNPCQCPWGIKAFSNYLGPEAENAEAWRRHDASHLIASSPFTDILVDVGAADTFYKQGQLLPERLQQAADAAGKRLTLRMHIGYGHDFYFYSTVISDHVEFHARAFAAAGAGSV